AEREEKQGRPPRSPLTSVGGDGALSCANDSGVVGSRHSLSRRLSRVGRSKRISLEGSLAAPRAWGNGTGDSDVRRGGLAGRTIRVHRSAASVSGRAVHAAVLSAHNGVARALHAISGTLQTNLASPAFSPIPPRAESRRTLYHPRREAEGGRRSTDARLG